MLKNGVIMDNKELRKHKILLVDDEPAQRMLLKMCLQQEEYTVSEAENGEQALAVLEREPDIRLVITDLEMPVINGFEFIQKVRTNDVRYRYIIVLTSSEEDTALVKALSLGADDFITKPVKPEEMRLRVKGGLRLLRLEIQEEIILGMAKLAEYRSDETGYHLERVYHYTRILGRYLSQKAPQCGVSSQMAEEIARVSPLHDIGKVAIPDSILHKPGGLTPREFEVMKEHAAIGGQLINDIYEKSYSPYLKIAFEVAMFHHERYDGSGYPKGLKGEEIPVSARIMALADIYDAMTSKRCYKEAMTHQETKKLILESCGSHIDPKMVDAFLDREEEWLVVSKKFKDKD